MLNYPPLDFVTDPETKGDRDRLLTARAQAFFTACYLRDASDAHNPLASPLLAEDLSDLPPALIITAEKDVLRDEGEAYGRNLNAAGVDVVVTRYNGMIHDFGLLNVLSQVPATRAALHQAAEELKTQLTK